MNKLIEIIESHVSRVNQEIVCDVEKRLEMWSWGGSKLDTSIHKGIKLDFNGCNLGSVSNPNIIKDACSAIGVQFLTAIISAKKPVYTGDVARVVYVLSELMALDSHPLFLVGTHTPITIDRAIKCVVQVTPGSGSIVLPKGNTMPPEWVGLS